MRRSLSFFTSQMADLRLAKLTLLMLGLVACMGSVRAQEGTQVPDATIGLPNASLPLDRGWRFRQIEPGQALESGWLAATVPGDVHLDLLANQRIPDPFYRDNEAKLQWIGEANWEYETAFEATPALLSRANVDLVFDGLDTIAEVYLNDHQVLSADNMFRVWRVPAKAYLHAGKNVLRVEFSSPVTAAKNLATADPMQPRTKVRPESYLRKAPYQRGWDFAPCFETSGIWRPVRLEAWDKARIADFAIRQRDVSKEAAHLDAQVEVEASVEGPATVDLSYTVAGQPIVFSVKTDLHAGRNKIDIPVSIQNPKLWYPIGYGEQPLYEFAVQVSVGETVADQRKTKVGLRSVVLDRHPDQWGRSFQFVVNGVPIFAKGANAVPFDSFPNRTTAADMRSILQSACDANMNMIRLWGGGYYQTDEFYSLCDELGLMVWQDFMFHDWPPGTYAFKQNIEAEAEDQVRRLRNHPSIVLWCGNNETEVLWTNKFRRVYDVPPPEQLQKWKDYLTAFCGILTRVVARLDDETPYWSSSPSADYEEVSETYKSGDEHHYTWWDHVPFSSWESLHPRFMSEYGWRSFPGMRTIEAYTLPEDRKSIDTPILQARQKMPDDYANIHEAMLWYYPEPKDFPSFVYVSQVVQGESMKLASEHFRRNRPETMGCLYWQLNDTWPGDSWSSLDYYGRWKALHYFARRFYAPILVSPHVEEGVVKVYVVSDRTEAQPATLRVRLMDFEGKVLLDEKQDITVTPQASEVRLEWPFLKLTQAGASDTSRVFVVAELTAGGTPVSRNIAYLVPTKEVHLPPARLAVEASGRNGKYKIAIGSPVLARDVHLSFGDLDAKVSDNYVDVLPGETVEIAVQSDATLDQLKAQMSAISLTDAFAPESSGSAPAEK